MIRKQRVVKEKEEELKLCKEELAEEAEKLGHMTHELAKVQGRMGESAQEIADLKRDLDREYARTAGANEALAEAEKKMRALLESERPAPVEEEKKAPETLPVPQAPKQRQESPRSA